MKSRQIAKALIIGRRHVIGSRASIGPCSTGERPEGHSDLSDIGKHPRHNPYVRVSAVLYTRRPDAYALI